MFIVAGIFAQNEPNVCVVCASLYVCVCACTFYWITQVWVWKIEQIFLATFEPLKWQPASGRNLISMDVYDLLNEYRIQQVHWIELDRIDSNELEFQNRRKEEKNQQRTEHHDFICDLLSHSECVYMHRVCTSLDMRMYPCAHYIKNHLCTYKSTSQQPNSIHIHSSLSPQWIAIAAGSEKTEKSSLYYI